MSDENERTAAESNAGGGEAGASSGPRAGWYPDPAGSPRQRWWDGSGWTESLRDAPAATPVAPVPPVAPAAPVAPPSPPLYGQTSSGQATSYGQSASGQSASGPAAPGPIAPGAVPGQQAPAQPQYGQQAPAQPQYGQQAPVQPQYGQQAPVQPQYGQQAPHGQQAPYAQQNPYGQQNLYAPQPYASAPRSAAPQPRDPAIVSSTPWIWVVVLLPLLSALSILLLPPDLVVESAMSSAYGPTSSMGVSTAYLLGLGAVQVIGFLIYAAEVVFAFLDWRQLKRAGIQRPFHWAWAFLAAPYVYVIGRSVVVKRVTGGGLLPLWILLGVIAVSFVVGIVWAGALLSEMSQSFPSMMY